MKTSYLTDLVESNIVILKDNQKLLSSKSEEKEEEDEGTGTVIRAYPAMEEKKIAANKENSTIKLESLNVGRDEENTISRTDIKILKHDEFAKSFLSLPQTDSGGSFTVHHRSTSSTDSNKLEYFPTKIASSAEYGLDKPYKEVFDNVMQVIASKTGHDAHSLEPPLQRFREALSELSLLKKGLEKEVLFEMFSRFREEDTH